MKQNIEWLFNFHILMVNRVFFQGRLLHSYHFSFSAFVMKVSILQGSKITDCETLWQIMIWYAASKTIKFPLHVFAFLNLSFFNLLLHLFLPVSKTSLISPLPAESVCLFVFQMEYWQCVETVFDLSFCERKSFILTSSKVGKSFF